MSPIARCCGSSTCGCNVQGGTGVTITGTGSASDPFVINADLHVVGQDNQTFDVNMVGSGTVTDPFRLSVAYAPTASINDLPDVDTAGKTTGQVLGYNGTIWVPVAAATAPVGAVAHNSSLVGDGSAGSPLQTAEDPDRMLSTTASGLGLSDIGMNSVVRHYADAVARSTAVPAPMMNTLSVLDSNPGQVDYWTGSEWRPVTGTVRYSNLSTPLLQLSGPWTPSTPVEIRTGQMDVTTDGSGRFTLLSTDDLDSLAGVLSAQVQSTGAIGWQANINPTGGEIIGTAYSMSGGAVLANQQVSLTYIAHLY